VGFLLASWTPIEPYGMEKMGKVVKALREGCRTVKDIVNRTGLSASEILAICEYIPHDEDMRRHVPYWHEVVEAAKEVLRNWQASLEEAEGPPPALATYPPHIEELLQPLEEPTKITIKTSPGLAGKHLGHVIISNDRPAKADGFWITIRDADAGFQLGTIVVAEGDGERVIGIIDDIEFASRPSSAEQWYEDRMKQHIPLSPSLSYPIEQYAHVRVLARDPPLKAPPRGRWSVRYPTQDDLNVLFRRIPKHFRVLAGFLRGPGGDLIPVYFHAEFLVGTEGAHINITGKTGLATKTSYAVFLAHSVLSWASRAGEKVAVVMFNVKRGDLMRLHWRPGDMEEARRCILKWAQIVGMEDQAELMVELWERVCAEGVDPFKASVKYFTYHKDPYCDKTYEHVEKYWYGLWDLAHNPWNVITAIYGPEEDIPGTQLNMIYTYFDALHAEGRVVSFEEMRHHFEQYASIRPPGRRGTLPRDFTAPRLKRWRTDVADAIFRRLDGFLRRATHVVTRESSHGRPIKFERIEEGKINVVQLFGLDPAEKRLVVNAVLGELLTGLQRPEKHVDRVMVFVDELNAYAPKARSPIKEHVLEIVARGRDLGLSLCGAQQFASQIDLQVLGNCSTKVVGNTDPAEVSSEVYKFLGSFRSAVPYLEKGEMIVYHPLFASPIPVLFPVPLYKVIEELARKHMGGS